MLYESYQIKKTFKAPGCEPGSSRGRAPWERLLGEGGQDAEPKDRARGGKTQLRRQRARGGSGRGLMAWVLGGTPHPHPENPPASQREGLGVWGWLCHICLGTLGGVPELLDGVVCPRDKYRLRALRDGDALCNAHPGGLLDHLPGWDAHHLQGPARESLCCAVGLLGTQPRVLVGSSELHSAFLPQDTLR